MFWCMLFQSLNKIIYRLFCYNICLDNEDLFQCGSYIREQFEHNVHFMLLVHILFLRITK